MSEKKIHRCFSTCNNKLTSEAYVSINGPDDTYKTIYASIYNVKVMDGFKRCGIGSMLVNECIDWARSNVINVVLLVADANNYPAIFMYKKIGFHIFKNHKWNNNYYIMRKFI